MGNGWVYVCLITYGQCVVFHYDKYVDIVTGVCSDDGK